MASYQVVICNTVSPNQLRTTTCPTGTYGHVVTIQFPDNQSFYGMPNISAADMGIIGMSIAAVWALAFIFKKLMSML